MIGTWITWETQRRNKGICSALGWPLHEITYSGPRWRRYLYCMMETLRIIREERPRVVVAQNPSIVLATLVITMKKVFGYKAVIDAHNSGIYPMEGKNRIMMLVSGLLQQFADVTIVTNDQLRALVESNGGRAVVLPDRLPEIPPVKPYPVSGRINLAYICTYSTDEPYHELLQAARLLPEDIVIYVTGKYRGKIDERSVPNNVKLLGFISDEDFWALLSSVDFIIDLTLRENCLVCGAYEAVALEKPLVLSDTKALREYFNQGCIYVSPSKESIFYGIMKAIEQRDSLEKDILSLKSEIQDSWNKRIDDLLQVIEQLN